MSSSIGRRALLYFLPSALLGALLLASFHPAALASDLAPDYVSRVADPKLAGGGVRVAYHLLPPGTVERVVVEVLDGAAVICEISNADEVGSTDPIELFWDGRDDLGRYLDTGSYTVRIRLDSGEGSVLVHPISIVRLGVTEMRAESAALTARRDQTSEYQMVYFKRNATLAYYVTPAIHEYLAVAGTSDWSDLDLNDGEPRPAPPVHAATDQPVMNGTQYENRTYNYPLCYRAGATPRFALTFGSTSTTATGGPQGVGYPVPGVEIRAELVDDAGDWQPAQDVVLPGGEAVFLGPELPKRLARTDRTLDLSFRYSEDGGASWHPVPGFFSSQHRFYTILGRPYFHATDTGQQYAGPWVEVVDYAAHWSEALGIVAENEKGVVAAVIQGFFGQQGPLPTAIEGVIYDAFPLGGNGGANHYFINSQHRIQLSALLNNHANGVYVNCSDCAGSTSTMIAMLGVPNVQLVHLGGMTLKAIWGIGAPAYTTNLWGGGSHGFSFHKIITRDGAVHVSDACMSLDEDGKPEEAPGIPGYNCDRPWDGVPAGYNFLSSYNNVSRTLQDLPRLQ